MSEDNNFFLDDIDNILSEIDNKYSPEKFQPKTPAEHNLLTLSKVKQKRL